MRCEDFPCCGHESRCCPDFDESGKQLNQKCVCGAVVSIDSPYSLCQSCLNKGLDDDYCDREDEDDLNGGLYDDDPDEDDSDEDIHPNDSDLQDFYTSNYYEEDYWIDQHMEDRLSGGCNPYEDFGGEG